MPTNAPAHPYEAAWIIDGIARSLQLRSAVINSPLMVTLEIGWDGSITAANAPLTADPLTGEFTALHVLVSLQSPQVHGWQPRRRSIALVTCPPITAITNWTPADHITLQLTASGSAYDRISQIPLFAGAWRITCVAVSSISAQLRIIGELAVQI
ncbi:MAG: hypothetical protein K6U09_12580 [Acidobacteriia bacterium]|nr:hypothetical protein [Terriglobia bacterium]